MIKDSRFKLKNEFSDIHPEYQAWMLFNDDPSSRGTIYFKSYLREDPQFKTLLATGKRYYKNLLKNDIENPEFKVEKGGYLVLPHSRFLQFSSDGGPVIYRVKDSSRL